MGPNIDDLADDRTRGIQSVGENYYDTFLLKRPKTEWSPHIDETAKDLSSGIQISDLALAKDDFGPELGTYYRRGLKKTVGSYADLPSVLEEKVDDRKLGLLVYQLNELSNDITTTDLGVDDVENATEAVIEKLLTRHVGNELSFSFDLSGGTVSDIVMRLFKNETIASNIDVLMSEFEESASRGLLSLMDEPQMMIPLWDHQREALEKWNENDNRGYVDMATATGKTVLGLGALALKYGELHPTDQGVGGLVKQQNTGGSDDILIVAHSELILEQWRREFENHLNIPQERTAGSDDITLEWGTIHFRTPQSLVNEDRVAYDLVLLDEAHHYATGSEWGSLLDEFDGDVLAMSGSVDDAGSDSERIKERLSNSIGPEIKRYTITEARADGVIPSFDWEVRYAPYDTVGDDLENAATRSEQAFQDFRKQINQDDLSLDTKRRLRTYEDVRRFSHTTEGNTLKQQNEGFRDLVTRLFSRQTKQWNLSPVLDAVVDLIVKHSTTEKVVVLADSNAQVEELESRLNDIVDPSSIYLVTGSQSRSEQRETIDAFDEPESSAILLGTGDLLGEGVDMQNASVAVNMATGGVNPELVQRIGRVLRNPDDTPKHSMFYNVVGIPPSEAAAVPREDGKQIIEQAAGFCSLGRRIETLPGFATADSVDNDVLETLLDAGATFIDTLDADGEYDWNEGVMEREDLQALYHSVQNGDNNAETILGEWEEYAWKHSKDKPKSPADKATDNTPNEQEGKTGTTDQQHEDVSGPKTNATQGLSEANRNHITDLIRLQPTKNSELQDEWGFPDGSKVHQYLQSELSDYYFRDEDSLIRASPAAETVAETQQTEFRSEDDSSSTSSEESNSEEDDQIGQQPNRKDLLEALVTLYESKDRVPTRSDVINEGKYSLRLYGKLFDSLDNALEECKEIQTDSDVEDTSTRPTANEPTDSEESEQNLLEALNVLSESPPKPEAASETGSQSDSSSEDPPENQVQDSSGSYHKTSSDPDQTTTTDENVQGSTDEDIRREPEEPTEQGFIWGRGTEDTAESESQITDSLANSSEPSSVENAAMDIISTGHGEVTYDLTKKLEDMIYEDADHPEFLLELKRLAERHNLFVSEITIDHDVHYNIEKWEDNSTFPESTNDEEPTHSESFAQLSGFQRDLLALLADMESPKGLEIKEKLEQYYDEEIHHGRLYPNLDTLCEEGLIVKNSLDERSNAYELTSLGTAFLQERRDWENALLNKNDDISLP
jgi:superfamily II DNA or RNA helicase/DNA-binding PadR family transcriptional regulator